MAFVRTVKTAWRQSLAGWCVARASLVLFDLTTCIRIPYLPGVAREWHANPATKP